MTIPAENVGRLRKLIAEMRMHMSGPAMDARYTPAKWRELCDDLEACLPGVPEGKPTAPEEKPNTTEDALRGLGGMIGAGLGLAMSNGRGELPNVTVYVTCNGK